MVARSTKYDVPWIWPSYALKMAHLCYLLHTTYLPWKKDEEVQCDINNDGAERTNSTTFIEYILIEID
jgi:hypothetical protein